jgi:hypothetical protein
MGKIFPQSDLVILWIQEIRVTIIGTDSGAFFGAELSNPMQRSTEGIIGNEE